VDYQEDSNLSKGKGDTKKEPLLDEDNEEDDI